MTTVLLTHPSAELYGSDLQLVETAIALRQAGASVVVALAQDGPLVTELHDAGAEVEIVDAPVLRKAHLTPRGIAGLFLHTVRAAPRMVGIVRRHRPHAVVVNTVTIPAWLGISRFAGVAPVCHVHEAEADAALPVRIGLNAPLLLARDVVVNSATARDVVVGAVPPLRRRTRIVYNGVPGPGDGPAASGRPDPDSSPGDPAGTPAGTARRVVLVGRLSPRKGTDVALEAVGRLRQEGRDVRLTLCGSVFAGYEWFEEELRARATRPDLAGAVDFAGYADPWEWFARADVVVVPSRVEPFGNVAVQALRAQRPLVVSRTQGLAEIVRDGETGRSVPPGDPEALAGAVAELLDDPERAAALATTGRKDSEERFGVERYRTQMARVVLPRHA
ncbi:glycosyltransferase family 4 protein [Myceligenerans indicum]|uniref:Glycosyltransferase family 4 protein n=1 Tax=Myceligenerans indicum TaxID=2593663 RepID=A0ABS1LEJ7_9MICO|nr:glycosyltransferase family 4 protein [Myceligenerans indicum]MBL0884706.1 glycosyltransferase family 4 protein [Myceligenerans indicum]